MGNAEFRKRLDDGTEIGFLLRRIKTRHLEDAASGQMDAADVRRLEAHIVLLAAREPRESVVNAEYIPAMARRLTGNCGDNTVDAGRGAASADNRNHILDTNHEIRLLFGIVCTLYKFDEVECFPSL